MVIMPVCRDVFDAVSDDRGVFGGCLVRAMVTNCMTKEEKWYGPFMDALLLLFFG